MDFMTDFGCELFFPFLIPTAELSVLGEEDGFSLSEELVLRETRLAKIEEPISVLRAREERDHPNEPIDPKRQISFADPNARCFTKKSDGMEYIYNSQAAVDMESQIIVENHIEDCVIDAGAGETSLTKIKKEQGVVPDHMVMDSGYANTDTLEICERHEVTPVCAPSREKGWRQAWERGRRRRRDTGMIRGRTVSSVLTVWFFSSLTGRRMARGPSTGVKRRVAVPAADGADVRDTPR